MIGRAQPLASHPPAAGPTASSLAAVYAAGLVTVLIWAGTAIVTKIAVRSIDPVLLALLRTVVPGVLLVPAAFALRVPRPRGSREIGWLVLSAVCAFIGFPLCYTLALRYTTASHVALLLASQSIFTGLIAASLERRAPTKRWIAGCVVALAGEVALIAFRFGLSVGGSLTGDLWAIAAALVSSSGYVAGARLATRIGTWGTTVWGNILAALIALGPLLYLGAPVDWSALDWTVWAAVAYIAIGASFLAYVLWYWAMARGGVARVSLLLFTNPIFTILLAVLFLGERLTGPLLLSGAAVLVGIWLAQRR
ncbi:MAG TPA: DMT family transporter [Alphaproteobacteria bacterium]|nr:DMT family transporter [Alphaproteobacteria bacterium]